MLLFGYTRPFASIFTGQDNASVSLINFPVMDHSKGLQNDSLTIWLAVLSIYLIDFSINAGMFCEALYFFYTC